MGYWCRFSSGFREEEAAMSCLTPIEDEVDIMDK
jgi:hypothetical protein